MWFALGYFVTFYALVHLLHSSRQFPDSGYSLEEVGIFVLGNVSDSLKGMGFTSLLNLTLAQSSRGSGTGVS